MADQKYCRNCGAPNLPEAKFCANCSKEFVSAASAAPPSAASAAAVPWEQLPQSDPSPEPTIFGLSRKFVVIGIIALFVLLTLGCVAIAMMPPSTPTPTVQATVAPTATVKATATPVPTATPKPTATPAPTAMPTLSSFYGLLVEHPASASTDDLTSKINQEEKSFSTPVTPFHRATIDGRDVYIGTSENDKGTVVKMYIFPLGSYNEARTAQAAYVKQLQAKGFTISNEDTTNSKEQSIINTDNGVQSANVQALGFNTDSGTAAMTIYIPQGKGSAA